VPSRPFQVVGAAILSGGRVLAARRTRPAAVAGRWEFPGGKVELGETPEDAVVREVAEELGCVIEVDGWLGVRSPVGPAAELTELTIARVRLVAGWPVPHEHDEVRWLAAGELGDVDWLDADRPFLPELRGILTGWVPSSSTRGPRRLHRRD